MSMEINGKDSHYLKDYEEWLKKMEQEKTKEPEKGQNAEKTSDKLSDLHDEYISSEKSGVKSSGLYRLGQDENGRKKVLFDDPKKPAKTCTTNTDKVDREIKKLKEKQQQLEQQILSASGNQAKRKELERKLSQVESELNQKDNDTYRRQNAIIS